MLTSTQRNQILALVHAISKRSAIGDLDAGHHATPPVNRKLREFLWCTGRARTEGFTHSVLDHLAYRSSGSRSMRLGPTVEGIVDPYRGSHIDSISASARRIKMPSWETSADGARARAVPERSSVRGRARGGGSNARTGRGAAGSVAAGHAEGSRAPRPRLGSREADPVGDLRLRPVHDRRRFLAVLLPARLHAVRAGPRGRRRAGR